VTHGAIIAPVEPTPETPQRVEKSNPNGGEKDAMRSYALLKSAAKSGVAVNRCG
jgi:hypothetical protein